MSGLIESQVSIESLAASKRQGARLVLTAGERTALALGRTVEQGVELATGLFALLLGVSQAYRAPAVDLARLPPDVQRLMDGEEAVDVFVRVGRWLVEGSR